MIDKDFQQALSKRVFEYFEKNNITPYGNTHMYFKALSILLLWVLSLLAIFLSHTTFNGLIALYILQGFCSLQVIFNISHDAVHETLSPKKSINSWLGYTFNLLGGNKYSWFLKHNLGHHTHTNVHGKDIDIETAPLFRVSPYTPLKKHYRFQSFYILPLYCFLSLLLIFIVDFTVMYQIKPHKRNTQPLREWVILIFSKLFYIGYIIILPVIFLPFGIAEVLLCFFLMHCVIGLFFSLVLLPSHFVAHAQHFILNTKSHKQHSWAEHQLSTTIDIAPRSKLANALLGGLNTNVIHHIFPTICHIHFLPLVKILEQTAMDYNKSYVHFSIGTAMKEHIRYMHAMGRKEDPYQQL